MAGSDRNEGVLDQAHKNFTVDSYNRCFKFNSCRVNSEMVQNKIDLFKSFINDLYTKNEINDENYNKLANATFTLLTQLNVNPETHQNLCKTFKTEVEHCIEKSASNQAMPITNQQCAIALVAGIISAVVAYCLGIEAIFSSGIGTAVVGMFAYGLRPLRSNQLASDVTKGVADFIEAEYNANLFRS